MLGAVRFDTLFVRNLIFMTNVLRVIRLKLNRDLVYSRDIILKSEQITRFGLTEFMSNQTYMPRAKAEIM
jgi:hypothetical protein